MAYIMSTQAALEEEHIFFNHLMLLAARLRCISSTIEVSDWDWSAKSNHPLIYLLYKDAPKFCIKIEDDDACIVSAQAALEKEQILILSPHACCCKVQMYQPILHHQFLVAGFMWLVWLLRLLSSNTAGGTVLSAYLSTLEICTAVN